MSQRDEENDAGALQGLCWSGASVEVASWLSASSLMGTVMSTMRTGTVAPASWISWARGVLGSVGRQSLYEPHCVP